MTILELLRPTPVPAPVLVGAGIEGEECEVPTLLLTRLPGHAPTEADIAANRFCPDLAQTLAVVHNAGRSLNGQLAPYRLYYDRAEATPPRWLTLTNTRVWHQAAAAVRAIPPASRQTMIHRDFHPKNTLWSRADSPVSWTRSRPRGDRPDSTSATCGGT
jgi:Ser/Thr protein kinase RdoA (MazF antagonist)